jgi:hypothetical protein
MKRMRQLTECSDEGISQEELVKRFEMVENQSTESK